jgi:hypothetical protein
LRRRIFFLTVTVFRFGFIIWESWSGSATLVFHTLHPFPFP